MSLIPSQPDPAVASCQLPVAPEAAPSVSLPASPRLRFGVAQPPSAVVRRHADIRFRPAVEHSRGRRCHKNGFTLVEVMISIAIALVLILGISQIFSMAQRTTGAGTQVLESTEKSRGVQQMLLNDARGITNSAGDSPGLVILSYAQAAWRNRLDQQQDVDHNPATLNDPANPGNSMPAPESTATIDDRVHRTDVFAFFARGQFTRRTGEGTNFPYSLTAPTTAQEAFIWYGHLALPDNNEIKSWQWASPGGMPASGGGGPYWSPGEGTVTTNQNNFFASDWILGRQVILLSPRGKTDPETHIRGTSQALNPLWLATKASTFPPSVASDATSTPLYASRYDLADTTIAAFRSALGAGNTTWWQGLSGWNPAGPQQTRFDANPFAKKPGTAGGANPTQQLSAAIAQTSPIFIRGCTQFIVEFAGDYVTQDVNGKIGTVDATGRNTGGGPDGQIDYVDVPNPNNPADHTRQIRWYGFPRDTAGDNGPIPTTATNPGDGGVLPVGVTMAKAGVSPPPSWLVSGNLAFERVSSASYTWPSSANPSGNGLPAWSTAPYACAWGADTDALGIPRPKMIRITIGIDDPSGHLNTQQVYEYVFNLP